MNLEERKINFMNRVATYLETYPKQTLRAFFDYWSEHNEGGNKMRFEMQKVFNLQRRLNTWYQNEQKWNGNRFNANDGTNLSDKTKRLFE